MHEFQNLFVFIYKFRAPYNDHDNALIGTNNPAGVLRNAADTFNHLILHSNFQ